MSSSEHCLANLHEIGHGVVAISNELFPLDHARDCRRRSATSWRLFAINAYIPLAFGVH